jgi:hypothetical protein
MQRTVIWLFLIALAIRGIVATLQVVYGINRSLNFDLYLYGSFNPGLELYRDFYIYYVAQLADMTKGMIPYRDFGYSYPPLFLYSLLPFYSMGGSFLASIPVWLSDAATAPLVYLVARRFCTPKLSFAAGISYALSPFFLIYEGYLWYSSQPMTFFMVLSLYLLLIRRPLLSVAVFAICVLFKQELILLAPIYLVWYLRNYPTKTVFKALGIMGSIILAVSLPFILICPWQYLTAISYGVLAQSYPPELYSSASNTISQLANSATAPQSLSCDTISSTWRSLVCHYGAFTYTDAKLIPPWTVIFSGAFMDEIGVLFFVPMLGMTIYNLIRLRNDRSVLFLSCSVILTSFLAFFAIEIHFIYRYYLVPVYIFPLVSARTRHSMLFAIAVPLVSLVFPSGNVQLLFPLFDVLMVLLLNQKSTSSANMFMTRSGNITPS